VRLAPTVIDCNISTYIVLSVEPIKRTFRRRGKKFSSIVYSGELPFDVTFLDHNNVQFFQSIFESCENYCHVQNLSGDVPLYEAAVVEANLVWHHPLLYDYKILNFFIEVDILIDHILYSYIN
jgi:hypothetical protein